MDEASNGPDALDCGDGAHPCLRSGVATNTGASDSTCRKSGRTCAWQAREVDPSNTVPKCAPWNTVRRIWFALLYVRKAGVVATRPPQARVVRAGKQIGDHLSAWRKLQNLTAEQLAQRAGISRTTLYKLETGNLGVSLGAYLNVLRALGQMDQAVAATDPYETDLGRARADAALPQRVRHPAR